MRSTPQPKFQPRIVAASSLLAAGLFLAACGQAPDTKDGAKAETKTEQPIVVTYDGGLFVLDGESLDLVEDIKLDGYNRVSPAGDDRHVLVSTAKGFRILDAAAAKLSDDTFKADKPGHVVHHADKTVLFADGTGDITVFDPEDLGAGLPKTQTFHSDDPHHGVAVTLEDGRTLATFGDEESAKGVRVLDAKGKETDRDNDCPGTHGEATAADEVVAFGCENGVLVYADGKFSKIDSPDKYGRVGSQEGHEESTKLLGDYKTDPEAELERPERVSVIDPANGKLKLVDLGTSYSFQSLGRGPHGEGLVLGTDGALHVIDMDSAKVSDSFPVIDKWEEPLDWQQTRPSLFVGDHTAYVTSPDEKKIYAVDTHSGEITAETTLPQASNEITGAL
ncbi:zinc metallochaperone AztD [Stackebrandtia nassauensis]|nr:zinc metallochaperone AztD [Stackebrandtia nassauensis]